MSRASFAASSLSRSSTNITEPETLQNYPDTETSHLVSSQYTLSEAIHARRADFTKEHSIRIKIGTWNVAGKKGTERDIAEWFVNSKGISENLTGLDGGVAAEEGQEPRHDHTESLKEQEKNVTSDAPTIPKNDTSELPAGEEIGLYVLGLQEMVDISSASEALRPYTDSSTANKWKDKLAEGLPEGYQLVAEQQLIGLMLFIYASPTVAAHVSSVSTKTCGTGLMGYLGNKGAVVSRIVLGETTRLVFVNCHLSSGLGKAELDRRNWDAQQIVSRVKFDPIVDSLGCVSANEEKIGDEDFCFWFGDLNYRLVGIPGDDVRRLLTLHTRNEYDQSDERKANGHASKASVASVASTATSASERPTTPTSTASSTTSPPSPSSSKHSFEDAETTPRTSIDGERVDPNQDPAHLQTTLNSLLTHDELADQKKHRKVFHDGWREGPITFLPTYKYDAGSVAVFDSGEKKRAPSWCDRILYRTRKDKLDFDNILLEEEDAKRRDVDISKQGVDKAADDENNMFYDYDPEADGDDDQANARVLATGNPAQEVFTKEGYNDIIQLEYYVSHQRVLSSDHKPLDAIFRLQYDAADPALKSKVHADVAKDLDRLENEGRPVVTVVPDATPEEEEQDKDGINFGHIRFEETKMRALTVANTGRAPAFFGFVNHQVAEQEAFAPTPSWLGVDVEVTTEEDPGGAEKITKNKNDFEWAEDVSDVYSLEPGNACIIKMAALINDPRRARELNNGGSLEDILILRIRDGRDHFMPIRAVWSQTSFCRSIPELVKIPEGGIRKAQEESVAENKRIDLQDSPVRWSAPRELFLLTETIENMVERIVAEWSMLSPDTVADQPCPWETFAGWPFVEESWTLDREKRLTLRLAINEALDTGSALDKCLDTSIPQLHRLEAFAETLVLFLTSLEDGVITESLWKELEQRFFTKERSKNKRPADEQRAAVLEILSSSSYHSVAFVLVTSMLSRVVHELAAHFHEETTVGLGRARTGSLTSPKLPVPKRALDPDKNIARRQLMRKNLAVVFAKAMIRSPEATSTKARNATTDLKQDLVETFLDNDQR